MLKRSTPRALLCVALGLLLLWLGFAWQPAGIIPGRTKDVAQQSGELPAAGDFTLYGADGPVTLSDYRGQLIVLYFGYTFCPDVCPTALSLLAQALSELRPIELAQVRSFFVSVDPERDTPDVLKVYAPFFHPRIVGITGSSPQVAQVARQYDVRYTKQKSDANGNYAIDHTSYLYIIGADGKLAARLPHAAPPADIVRTIRSLLPPPH